MPYRIDFHAHTGHSSDSLLPAARLLERAAARGLWAICITDHNSLGGALQAHALVQHQSARFGGVRVIVGEEVKTTEGEVIGLFLTEQVPRGLSPEETVARIKGQGGLVTVPHPFDRLRGSRITAPALDRIASQIDAIEVLNARTTLASDNAHALEYARAHGLTAVAGSDCHTAAEVGSAYLELDAPPELTADGLRAAWQHGRVGGRLSSPLVHAGSKVAKWRKRLGLAPVVQL